MKVQEFQQRLWRRLQLAVIPRAWLRRQGWRALGAQIGPQTNVPRLLMPWPHQVCIGRRCVLEDDIFFKYDGYWLPGPSIVIGDRVFIGRGAEFNIRERIEVGHDSLIASGCKFIDHDHDMTTGDRPMNLLPCPGAPIVLQENVWLGVNVVVLQGVTIGRGAVVGAGAVVTKSIPPLEVWAGIPARKIGDRPRASDLLREGMAHS